nr:proteoglycan 4-like [Cherax quadricarinatus]
MEMETTSVSSQPVWLRSPSFPSNWYENQPLDGERLSFSSQDKSLSMPIPSFPPPGITQDCFSRYPPIWLCVPPPPVIKPCYIQNDLSELAGQLPGNHSSVFSDKQEANTGTVSGLEQNTEDQRIPVFTDTTHTQTSRWYQMKSNNCQFRYSKDRVYDSSAVHDVVEDFKVKPVVVTEAATNTRNTFINSFSQMGQTSMINPTFSTSNPPLDSVIQTRYLTSVPEEKILRERSASRNLQSSTAKFATTMDGKPSTTQYRALPTQYRAPPTQYRAPPTQYQAPPTQYLAPSTQYHAPPAQHPAPPTQYPTPTTRYPPQMTQHLALTTQYPPPATQYPLIQYPPPMAQKPSTLAQYLSPWAQHIINMLTAQDSESIAELTDLVTQGMSLMAQGMALVPLSVEEPRSPTPKRKAPIDEHAVVPTIKRTPPTTRHSVPITKNTAPTNTVPTTKDMAATTKNMAPTTKDMEPTTKNMAPTTKSMAPTTKSMAPKTQSMVPTTQNRAPTTQNRAPTTQNRAPTTKNRAPTTKNRAPTTKNRAPTTKNMVPTIKNMAPTTQNWAPTTQNMAPTTQTTVPTTQNMAPTTQNMVPTTQNMAPTTQNMAPTTQNMAPTTQNRVPTTKNMALKTEKPTGTVTVPSSGSKPSMVDAAFTKQPTEAESQPTAKRVTQSEESMGHSTQVTYDMPVVRDTPMVALTSVGQGTPVNQGTPMAVLIPTDKNMPSRLPTPVGREISPLSTPVDPGTCILPTPMDQNKPSLLPTPVDHSSGVIHSLTKNQHVPVNRATAIRQAGVDKAKSVGLHNLPAHLKSPRTHRREMEVVSPMTRDQVKQEVLSPPGKTAVSAASRVESVEELTETSDSKQCVDILANGMIKQEQVNHLEMCSMFIEAAGNEGSKCVCVPAFSYLAGGLGKSNMKSENWEENEEDVVKSEEFEGEELPFIMTTKCEDMTGFKTDHLEDKDAIDGLDDIIKTEEHFAEEDTVVNSYDSTWSSFCRPKVERVHPPVARHDCEDKMTVEDCRGGDSFLLDKELLDASMDTVVSVCRVSLTATDSCVRAEERPGNSQTFNSTHQETNETPTRSDNVFQPTKHYASESIENQNFEETFSDFNTELSIFEHPWDNYSKHGRYGNQRRTLM